MRVIWAIEIPHPQHTHTHEVGVGDRVGDRDNNVTEKNMEPRLIMEARC